MFRLGIVELSSTLLSDTITVVKKPQSQEIFSGPLCSGKIQAILTPHFVMQRVVGGSCRFAN
jgi:hypothetical protein